MTVVTITRRTNWGGILRGMMTSSSDHGQPDTTRLAGFDMLIILHNDPFHGFPYIDGCFAILDVPARGPLSEVDDSDPLLWRETQVWTQASGHSVPAFGPAGGGAGWSLASAGERAPFLVWSQ